MYIQARHRVDASCGFYRLDASLLSSCTKPVVFIKLRQLAADLLSSSRGKRCKPGRLCKRILILACRNLRVSGLHTVRTAITDYRFFIQIALHKS